MDEVFGNSSTETVVSVHDLDNKSPPSEIDQDTNKMTEELPTNSPSNDANELDSEPEASVSSQDPDPQEITRDSVIKCTSSVGQEETIDEAVFKVPQIPPLSLRHTQSVVVSKTTSANTRARAHSASGNIQTVPIVLKHHSYQNIPTNVSSFINTPAYVNVPRRRMGSSQSPKRDVQIELNTTNSAPSTPRGSRNPVSPRVTHSYIQLWTGNKQEECTSTDIDNSFQGQNQTGYVSMSSPYLRSPNSSIISDLASQLSSNPGICNSKNIFCPFCPRPFSHELNLKHHIQAIHRHELQKIACDKEPVKIQICPLCRARFFNLSLLPSHLLEFHHENVVDILDKHSSIKINVNEIKCPFCTKKVPTSKLGEDILLYHVLQLHSTEYERLIGLLFEPLECSADRETLTRLSTEDLAHALSFKPEVTSTPGLSLKFRDLTFECKPSPNSSHVVLNETWSSHCADRENLEQPEGTKGLLESQAVNRGILRSQINLTRKPSVKRELRFSVPPVTSEEFFIPESPESGSSSHVQNSDDDDLAEQDENQCPIAARLGERQNIPIRVDSLSSADFIEMNNLPRRKKRRLGVGLKSKKSFKKKKKETSVLVENVFDGLKNIGCSKSVPNKAVVATSTTRTFRKPKPVSPPTVPYHATSRIDTACAVSATSSSNVLRPTSVPPPPSQLQMRLSESESHETTDVRVPATVAMENGSFGPSPFGSMKLYSPLRMFRCNSCRIKFCDNETLGSHIRGRHRGFLGLLRPQFGCGICSAKFYENKYLVKHCLQHHTSLLEIRSPKKHKITIYRFSQD